MLKSENIRKLLEENRDVLLNGEPNTGICFDGIVNEDIYNNQKLKVVVLLKETNGNDYDGNEVSVKKDFDYVYWLRHQQVDNEPEYRKKGDEVYLEENVFYHHTFKKLCHWLSMFYDIESSGDTSVEKFLTEEKVDIEKVRGILNNIALINLKKTWGKEKTDVLELYRYVTKEDIAHVLKKQLKTLEPDVVLCCSPDVFWIAKELFKVEDNAIIKDEWKEIFFNDNVVYVKLYHPQWYGKKELILAEEVKDIFNWVFSIIK